MALMLKAETIERFGYDPDTLARWSKSRVVVLCPQCERRFDTQRGNFHEAWLCVTCARQRAGTRRIRQTDNTEYECIGCFEMLSINQFGLYQKKGENVCRHGRCRKCRNARNQLRLNAIRSSGKCIACRQVNTTVNELCGKCAAKQYAKNNTQHAKFRNKVLAAYGGKCACCGEAEPKFLTLDHVNNDGAEHRRQIDGELKSRGKTGGRSYTLLAWAKKNNYPDSLQILCYNCNCGKARNAGVCPHVSNSIICLTLQPFASSSEGEFIN